MADDSPRGIKTARKERKENADARRRQILDAVFSSIVKYGLPRTTLATIAQEAGLSQGVAVFYFQSKNKVLTEALRDFHQSYTAHWRAALDKAEPDPGAQLFALVAADFDPKICNPQGLSIWYAFWGEQSFMDAYAEITQEFDVRRRQAVAEICAKALPGQPLKATELARWVDTLTDGFWQNLHLSNRPFDVVDPVRSTVEFLCAVAPGLAARLRECATAHGLDIAVDRR